MFFVGATTGGALESRPEQRIYLDLSRCVASSCVVVGAWSQALTTAEISITDGGPPLVYLSGATATLRTIVGGFPLDITLESSDVGGVAFYGVGSSTTPPGVHPAVSQYTLAHGQLKLGGLTRGLSGATPATRAPHRRRSGPPAT